MGKVQVNHPHFSPWKAMEWALLEHISGNGKEGNQGDWEQHALTNLIASCAKMLTFVNGERAGMFSCLKGSIPVSKVSVVGYHRVCHSL